MAEQTPIEWTDWTLPIIAGCNYKSKGCRGCWAVKDGWRKAHSPYPQVAKLYRGVVKKTAGGDLVWTQKRRLIPERIHLPLLKRKGQRIFICSESDLFDAPDDFIDKVIALAALAPRHTLQVLTKEAGKMRAYFHRLTNASAEELGHRLEAAIDYLFDQAGLTWAKVPDHQVVRSAEGHFYAIKWPLPNLHAGVTVEDHAAAEERIPQLITTPWLAVRWISAEPLLGAIDLTRLQVARGRVLNALTCDYIDPSDGAVIAGPPANMGPIDWVVAGGESGSKARPMHIEWARSLRDQCAAARTPFLFKQWGAWIPCETEVIPEPRGNIVYPLDEEFELNDDRAYRVTEEDGKEFVYVGKKAAGRRLDGRLHSEFPAC